jgi:hypothetical protein
MPKPNPLTQGLRQQNRKTEPAAAAPIATTPQPSSAKTVAPSRVGRVLIGGHFAPEVQTALKIVAAEERTSIQALLAEGINAVFARRHKAQIAALSIHTNGEE